MRKFIGQQKEQELERQNEVFVAINAGKDTERTRIAQDLHDGIGAKLSGVKMQLEYVIQKQKLKNEMLNNIVNELDESIIEIREISHNLKTNVISVKGLKQIANDFILHLNRKGSCHFETYIELDNYQPSIDIQLCLYRVLNELLMNVYKHSGAKHCSVQIAVFKNDIEVICEDDGKGFNVNETYNGIGLPNIINRIKQLKGTVNIDSTGNGTTVIITLPISD